jgi:hypothetical protein
MRKIEGRTVTVELVADLARRFNHVPESAIFISAYFDYSRNAFVCLFEDDSYESIPEGSAFPIDKTIPVAKPVAGYDHMLEVYGMQP